jgi:hypothetical protein
MNIFRMAKKGKIVGLSGSSPHERFRYHLSVRRQADAKFKKAMDAAKATQEQEAAKAAAPAALVDTEVDHSDLLSAIEEQSPMEMKTREEGGSLFFFSSMVQVLEDSFSLLVADAH